MGVFYVLLFVPIILQHIAVKGHYIDYQKRNNAALAFFFLLLTVLVMFRHETVGNDTRNYIHYFLKYSKSTWGKLGSYSTEDGFTYFNKLISIFSKEPHFYLAVAAVVVNALIYPTYKRLCIDASLTAVLFCNMSVFVMMFSGIRQMLAVGVGCVAYEFTRNRKPIPFVIAVCIAMSFHTSAFMLAFMYPMYHAKITKKWLLVVIPVMAVVFVFNRQIFSVLGLFLERYTKYDASITQTGAYTMLFLFAAFAVFSFIIPDESHLDKETVGLRNFLLLALMIQMFAPLHTIAMRMNYYYIIFIPLLLPKIIAERSKRWNQVATLSRHVMLIFFLVYFFMNAYGDGGLHVFPYHFFWETV